MPLSFARAPMSVICPVSAKLNHHTSESSTTSGRSPPESAALNFWAVSA